MIHKLKCFPCYFQATLSGNKNFEIRNNADRGFQKGDAVILKEFNPKADGFTGYTGNEIYTEVTYVTNFLQIENHVVFGFKIMECV